MNGITEWNTIVGEFDDEIMGSLPAIKVDLHESLWNVEPGKSAKRYTKSVPTAMEPEMYEAIAQLANDPRLPFAGNISAMGRHVWAAGIESLRLFLDSDLDTQWRRLINARRRLTNEWYILKIEEQLDVTVEILRDWTAAGEWGAVYAVLCESARDIDGYPRVEYRRRAAMGWLKNPGVKQLLTRWEASMQDDDPAMWDKVVELFIHLEDLAGV